MAPNEQEHEFEHVSLLRGAGCGESGRSEAGRVGEGEGERRIEKRGGLNVSFRELNFNFLPNSYYLSSFFLFTYLILFTPYPTHTLIDSPPPTRSPLSLCFPFFSTTPFRLTRRQRKLKLKLVLKARIFQISSSFSLLTRVCPSDPAQSTS